MTGQDTSQGTSRRRFLGGAAVAAAGLAAAGAGVAYGVTREDSDPTADLTTAASPRADAVVAFYGARQAGIVTTQQERLMFAALDVTTTEGRNCSASWAGGPPSPPG